MGDIAAVAALLSQVFGFVVDPNGLGAMKLEHKLKVIHVAITIALDKHDDDAVDGLFKQYRELQKSTNT